MPIVGRRTLGGAGLAILLLAAVPGQAANASEAQTFLGQFGAWYAYRLNESGQRICYIVSKPTRSRGKYKRRGDVVAFVTHRPKDRERDVVNFQAGYTYKPGSKATAQIEKQRFELVTERDAAWSRNAAADKVLVAAMIKGYKLVLKGTSKSGVTTTDTYSLKGFTQAHKRINRACGVR